MRKSRVIAVCVCYYVVAAVLLVAASIVIKPAVGSDVLKNGGFEGGNLEGWYEIFAGGTLGSSTVVSPGYSGGYALEYSLTVKGVGWYELVQDVDVRQGSNYTVQFHYKSTVASGKVAFFCYDQEFGKVLYSSLAEFETGDNSWSFGSFQVSVPYSNLIKHTVLDITLDNTVGTVIIDDIQMKVTANP